MPGCIVRPVNQHSSFGGTKVAVASWTRRIHWPTWTKVESAYTQAGQGSRSPIISPGRYVSIWRPCSSKPRAWGTPSTPASSRCRSRAWTVGVHGAACLWTTSPIRTAPSVLPPGRVSSLIAAAYQSSSHQRKRFSWPKGGSRAAPSAGTGCAILKDPSEEGAGYRRSACTPVSPHEPRVDGRARLGRADERLPVHLVQPEPHVVAEDPLEVVHQRPVQVPKHRHAILDHVEQPRQRRLDERRPQRVVPVPEAVLGHQHRPPGRLVRVADRAGQRQRVDVRRAQLVQRGAR